MLRCNLPVNQCNNVENTCVELVMVLSAKIVAQSFTVDELSNAP